MIRLRVPEKKKGIANIIDDLYTRKHQDKKGTAYTINSSVSRIIFLGNRYFPRVSFFCGEFVIIRYASEFSKI